MERFLQDFSFELTNTNFVYGVGTLLAILVIGFFATRQSKEKRIQKDLLSCWKELLSLINKSNCHPILLRLAWSDAVTYDCAVADWPHCGGVNGSIRFEHELSMHANAGLAKAISLLAPVKRKFKNISWADLIQMAGVAAIRAANGPLIELNYGRIDVLPKVYDKIIEEKSRNKLNATTTILPCPNPPFPDGAPTADIHLRNIFYRLGLNNKETVALCGGHTIGRAFKERSGVCSFTSGDSGATKYTKLSAIAKAFNQPGIGMSGGCSWTKNWLHFDNSYYKRIFEKGSSGNFNHDDKAELLWLATDQALYDCPEYRPYFIKYSQSCDEFYNDYSAAHKKMSELGAKFQYVIRIDSSKLI